MTAKQMIKALQKVDPKTEVRIARDRGNSNDYAKVDGGHVTFDEDERSVFTIFPSDL